MSCRIVLAIAALLIATPAFSSPQDWPPADRALHDACALEYVFNCQHQGQEPQGAAQMIVCLKTHERLATFSKACQAALSQR